MGSTPTAGIPLALRQVDRSGPKIEEGRCEPALLCIHMDAAG